MLLRHALLTRFNLPTPGHEGLIRASARWLEDRFDLFERYCLPSVQSQTCKDFRWIIYFDPETPGWAKDKIAAYQGLGFFHPVFRVSVPKPILLADIGAAVGTQYEQLLTTSLDNDDMLARTFVERLQQAAASGCRERTVLNFPEGYTFAGGRLYRHRDASNAFASMCEPPQDALTIWHDWHTHLSRHAPIVQLPPESAWVQVIHGRNVSNRVRGWLVDPALGRRLFAFRQEELQPQTAMALMADRLRFLAIRQPREWARRLARTIITAILPRESLAAIKLRFMRLRGTLLGEGRP